MNEVSSTSVRHYTYTIWELSSLSIFDTVRIQKSSTPVIIFYEVYTTKSI